jgi:hypothetical protein
VDKRGMNIVPGETGNEIDPTLPNRAVLIEPPVAIIWAGGGSVFAEIFDGLALET